MPASNVLDLPPAGNSAQYHEVNTGDTLSAIAEKYGVSSEDLVEANGLDQPNAIAPGQLIYIPKCRQ